MRVCFPCCLVLEEGQERRHRPRWFSLGRTLNWNQWGKIIFCKHASTRARRIQTRLIANWLGKYVLASATCSLARFLFAYSRVSVCVRVRLSDKGAYKSEGRAKTAQASGVTTPTPPHPPASCTYPHMNPLCSLINAWCIFSPQPWFCKVYKTTDVFFFFFSPARVVLTGHAARTHLHLPVCCEQD